MQETKVNPVFGKLYDKYLIPNGTKVVLPANVSVERTRSLVKGKPKRMNAINSMIYVPYEICSYSRKMRMYRGQGRNYNLCIVDKDNQKLKKLWNSSKLKYDSAMMDRCNQHTSGSFQIEKTKADVHQESSDFFNDIPKEKLNVTSKTGYVRNWNDIQPIE